MQIGTPRENLHADPGYERVVRARFNPVLVGGLDVEFHLWPGGTTIHLEVQPRVQAAHDLVHFRRGDLRRSLQRSVVRVVMKILKFRTSIYFEAEPQLPALQRVHDEHGFVGLGVDLEQREGVVVDVFLAQANKVGLPRTGLGGAQIEELGSRGRGS